MKWGKYCFIRSLRDSSEKELESAQQCLALGWHAGSLAALIIIVGNRPQISYEHDIVNGTLCHWAPISSLPRAASKPQDGWIGISLPRFSCLACDQTLGKKVWVPYKLDHLYVMSFGWQGWSLEWLFWKQQPWPLWWCHFLLLPPVCCGFFLWEAVPGPPGWVSGFLSGFWAPLLLAFNFTSLSHICFLYQIESSLKAPSISLWISLTGHWCST